MDYIDIYAKNRPPVRKTGLGNIQILQAVQFSFEAIRPTLPEIPSNDR